LPRKAVKGSPNWAERKNHCVPFREEGPPIDTMVLVDTSIWVCHFRKGNPHLASLLSDGEVVCHPSVVGELACGDIKNREEILSLLQALPMAETAEHKCGRPIEG